MKFIVTRTSSWDNEQSPIKGAVQEKVTIYHHRNKEYMQNENSKKLFAKFHTDIEQLPDGSWRGKGKEKEGVWVIEIADIVEFVKMVGHPCIVSVANTVEDYPNIEIYDDYRE